MPSNRFGEVGIVIDSDEAIDERALAAGLRFDSGRARPNVTNRGRRVTVAMDDSFPLGPNTLYLSDLHSPAGERIEADLEVPFFVIDTKASLPSDVRLESYSRVVVEGNTIRRASPQDKAVYELFKGVRRTTRKRWEGAYDRTGKAVDFDNVRGKVMKARVGKYGKLQPRLHARLGERGSGRLSVAIWLRADLGGRQKKAERGEIKKPARRETDARRRFAELARSFAEQHKLYDLDEDLRVDNAAPVILAELDRREIRRLAASDEVSAIFLYEREGFDDLTNLIAIAQSDDAHDLGYTGSGVNVAVYERARTTRPTSRSPHAFAPTQIPHSTPDTHTGSSRTGRVAAPRARARLPASRPTTTTSTRSAGPHTIAAARSSARASTATTSRPRAGRPSTTSTRTGSSCGRPYPTIVQAAGNGGDDGVRQPQGLQLARGRQPHDDASAMSSTSVFRNPASDARRPGAARDRRERHRRAAVGLTTAARASLLRGRRRAAACRADDGVLSRGPRAAGPSCSPAPGATQAAPPGGATSQRRSTLRRIGRRERARMPPGSRSRAGRGTRPRRRGWDVGTLRHRTSTATATPSSRTGSSGRTSMPGRW